MYYREQLLGIRTSIIDRKAILMQELEDMPEELFFGYTKNARHYFSARMPAKGNYKKEHRVGITRDHERIQVLVRKKYIEQALKIIDENLESLDTMLAEYTPFDENSVMKEFMDQYPEKSDCVYSKRDSGLIVANELKSVNDFYEDGRKNITSNGNKVRSAGELYISSQLDRYDQIYGYEVPLGIPDLSFIPDFTIVRKRDHELIYWEHLGMVNSIDYMNYNKVKIQKYEDYGIVPWKNLIITYNLESGGINAKLIDAMIHAWLL